MTQRKYFGTDGIRGKTGDAVINAEFMLRLGWATGKVMSRAVPPRARRRDPRRHAASAPDP